MNGVSLGRENAGRVRLLVALSGVCVFAASCSGSGYQYVRQPQYDTMFKLPEEWTVFEDEEVLAQSGLVSFQLNPQADSTLWVRGFEGAAAAEQMGAPAESENPLGFTSIRVLLDREERESFSLLSLRNEAFPIVQLEQEGAQIEILDETELLENGLHGVRVIFDIKSSTGPHLSFNKTTLVDPSTRVVFAFLIGCRSDCYEENRDVIDEIVSSYSVGESL